MKSIAKNILLQSDSLLLFYSMPNKMYRGLLATLAMGILLAFIACNSSGDIDDDGITDDMDNCPNDPNPGQEDLDQDGRGDACDNCPNDSNPNQLNSDDADDGGDECDNNDDNDDYDDEADNCPILASPDLTDTDTDGMGDECDIDDDNDLRPDDSDNCRIVKNTRQENSDIYQWGDACDVDDDGDGLIEIGEDRIEGITGVMMFDNIRYNLAGTSYATSTEDEGDDTGCGGQEGILKCEGYELEDPIDLTGMDWTPIGLIGEGTTDSPYDYIPFTATLEGNDNLIQNLMIESDSDNVGFFTILSGTARRLRFEGGMVTATIATNPNSTDPRNIGTLAAQSSGSIDHVSSDLEVTSSDRDNDNVGGLVGVNNNGSTIQNSYATGNRNIGNGHNQRVGGLVGLNNNGSRILDSYTMGDVSSGNGNFQEVGGLVGRNFNGSTIQNSYSMGNSNGGAGNNDRVGGLVGQNDNGSTIQNSYSMGNSNGGDGGNDRVGGLVGVNNNGSTIHNSYSIGDSNGGDGDNDRVGGLVGCTANRVEVKTFNEITRSYAAGDVDGGAGSNDKIGGLLGAEGAMNINTITSSYRNSDANIMNGDSNTFAAERTLKQLQVGVASDAPPQTTATTADECTAAGGTSFTNNICRNVHYYDGWSDDDWGFGSDSDLPLIRSNRPDTDGNYPFLCGQTTPEKCPSP